MSELELRAVLLSLSSFLIGGILSYLFRRRLSKERMRLFVKKFWTYALIINAMGVLLLYGSRELIILTHTLLLSVAAKEMYQVSKPLQRITAVCSMLVFVIIALFFIVFLKHLSVNIILYAFVTVCLFDAFSQIIGQAIGAHRLAPRVSPGKTWEGVAAGLFAAQIPAFVFTPEGWGRGEAVLGCIIVSLIGLGGDLSASWYKRAAGVKDFSDLIPGHGGILDRFDSFFAVGAAYGVVHVLL